MDPIAERTCELARMSAAQVITVLAIDDFIHEDGEKITNHLIRHIDPTKDALLVVAGPGGNTHAALTIALKIRQLLKDQKIYCVIPAEAGSAFGFFPLLSNEIF